MRIVGQIAIWFVAVLTLSAFYSAVNSLRRIADAMERKEAKR